MGEPICGEVEREDNERGLCPHLQQKIRIENLGVTMEALFINNMVNIKRVAKTVGEEETLWGGATFSELFDSINICMQSLD